MAFVGVGYIARCAEHEYFEAKIVFNEVGGVFGPPTGEHRNMRTEGVCYKDNYEGNALAAMIYPGKIDVRYHKNFSGPRVKEILDALLRHEGLAFMRDWQILSQGHRLL